MNDLLAQCIQCGLCLPACPTYALTPLERANPRGRIGLMRAVAEGELMAGDRAFAEAMYYCVGCRACETACPAGVQFGRLLEGARAAVEEAKAPGRPPDFPRRWLLERVLPYPKRLRRGARVLRLYRRTLRRSEPWRRWFGERFPDLAEIEPLVPDVPPQGRRWRLPPVLEPADVVNGGKSGNGTPNTRGTVAVHPGCVQPILLPEVNADTVQVLAFHGWRVVVPSDLRCCGALHAHQGETGAARELARANIAAFEASGAERLVSNAGGCGAHLKGYRHLLADEPGWASRAEAFSAAVVDVAEHLVGSGVRRPRRPFSLRATYHDSCHLVHGQRVAEAPRLLLGAIPGLDLAPLAESTWCCGSAGIYNLTHPEAAAELLERKIGHIRATGAELVVTGNPGCILQIASGLRAAGSPVRVVHPVSLLRVAYELPPLLPRS
ncbi:MAG TPA: heterodisulfide reductase-related iron-sulfur binding cluster [Gemmatimonadota bacterium]|nr:heterodisulfide reductase-related iron-sulfur binding cluster [Gemmatimonadota bacterium]